ncbi:MAG: 3-oxoacyl-[acyl-carrier-protein] synthase 2 [Gemmatimonadetes bacterium]|nr:3-oxoacyl-[acyl-carrier-protein] synthase 2 [Gemmatimonadota bacterium]
MERRRVAITGIGAVTPIGIGRDGLWDGLRREQSAVGTLTRFDPSMWRSHNAAEVNEFNALDFMEAKKAKRLDRFGMFAVASARQAANDARLDVAREDSERVGAMMGSALGGIRFAEEQLRIFLDHGIRSVDPSLALNVFSGAASCNIAIELSAQGPNSTNAMSCASGTIAVGEAFRAIRDGYADVMFAGASEAPLAPLCYGAFSIIRAMSTRNDDPTAASRPFDRDRDGFVMGEGAAVMVLEELDRAMARGAHIYAEVVGYGSSNDAHHMTAPRPDGSQAARSMRIALRDANVLPSDIEYVNAHGSSTPLNDPTETLAIHSTFGEHADKLQVSSTKAYYGHALGASGAIELAISALALEQKWLPPTLNHAVAADGCDLDYIPNHGRDADVEYAISNSFGFGGINAAVVLKRHDGV